MCRWNLEGKEKWKMRPPVTGNWFGLAREQKGNSLSPQASKSNMHCCDSLGIKWQEFRASPHTPPTLAFKREALGGVDWFHWQKRSPVRAIHYGSNDLVHLGTGQNRGRLYGIIYKQANDIGLHIWPDFIQLLWFRGFQVDTCTKSDNIIIRN